MYFHICCFIQSPQQLWEVLELRSWSSESETLAQVQTAMGSDGPRLIPRSSDSPHIFIAPSLGLSFSLKLGGQIQWPARILLTAFGSLWLSSLLSLSVWTEQGKEKTLLLLQTCWRDSGHCGRVQLYCRLVHVHWHRVHSLWGRGWKPYLPWGLPRHKNMMFSFCCLPSN